MDERLRSAYSHMERINDLQQRAGDSFSMDDFREAMTAQVAWQHEMENYRQLESRLKSIPAPDRQSSKGPDTASTWQRFMKAGLDFQQEMERSKHVVDAINKNRQQAKVDDRFVQAVNGFTLKSFSRGMYQ